MSGTQTPGLVHKMEEERRVRAEFTSTSSLSRKIELAARLACYASEEERRKIGGPLLDAWLRERPDVSLSLARDFFRLFVSPLPKDEQEPWLGLARELGLDEYLTCQNQVTGNRLQFPGWYFWPTYDQLVVVGPVDELDGTTDVLATSTLSFVSFSTDRYEAVRRSLASRQVLDVYYDEHGTRRYFVPDRASICSLGRVPHGLTVVESRDWVGGQVMEILDLSGEALGPALDRLARLDSVRYVFPHEVTGPRGDAL